MKNQTLTIKKMGINGEGIGYIDSKITFVKGALTGEEVLCAIDTEERRYLKGHVIKVLKKSPARVPGKNNHHDYGYSLFHMNYRDQLPFKKGLIKDAINKYTKFDAEEVKVNPVIGSEERMNYRHYAAFPIVYSHGKLVFGELDTVESFLTVSDLEKLIDADINHVLKRIQDILNKYQCKDYFPRVKKGLRYIMVRQFDNGMQVIFVTGKDGIAQEVTREIEAIDEVASVYYTINTTSHTDFKDKGYKRIYGTNYMTYAYNDQTYEFGVKAPALINPKMEEQYADLIKKSVDSDDSVLSVFVQHGLLEMSLPNEVLMLTGDEYLADDIRRNIEQLDLKNKRVKLGDVDEEMVHACKKRTYDTVLVSLHQDEMSEDIAASIIKSKVDHVILSSKNMSSLGEAIGMLQSRYVIEEVNGIDLDPNTPLVCGVIRLKRAR